jgi:predicted ATP-dependent endonuclease of OLD family
MRYTFFDIENFKGIEKIRIDLDKSPESNVYTLVGLNESGKTTILEAINFFSYKQETLESLDLPRYTIPDVHDLIPISKRENFNGDITITVGLNLDADDETKIRKHIFKEYKVWLSVPIKTIEITQSHQFENSKYKSKANTWDLKLLGTRGRQRIARKLDGDEWQGAVNYIKTLIPTILYFPNFLFDFPNKIYLEDSDDADAGKHKFYRDVIQDILDALESGTNIQTHILGRAKSGEKNDKRHLDSLLLSMGRNITEVVFNAWNTIFGIQVSDKEIIVNCDSEEQSKYYLEFKLKDSDGFYLIGERSLGFRWFFVFLLLTQYRGYRKNAPKNVLFLFDEPASNLHATAQSQLLSSLDKLTKNCKVIYTTHSHYLINPDWLEGVFVVKNEGLDYKDDDIRAYSAKKTRIAVDRYRSFYTAPR